MTLVKCLGYKYGYVMMAVSIILGGTYIQNI